MTVYPQVRTSADLLKSTIRIEELIPFLHHQKAKSCAIVNTKLYGLLPFWFEMKRAGIHPVVGLTIQLELTEEQSLPLVLYAKTNEGYRNLLKISAVSPFVRSKRFRYDGCLHMAKELLL